MKKMIQMHDQKLRGMLVFNNYYQFININMSIFYSSSAQDKMRVEIKPTVVPENEEEAAAAMSLVMKHLNSVRK